jgi:tRNA uridine 5-carboxymethylaminomethyl modification enzyme
VEFDLKYSGYQQRELRAAEKLRQLEVVKIPKTINYEIVPSLKRETKDKLNAVRPVNLGQASRISGITPADIMVLMIHLRKK